jgi:hypothetical protein
MKVEVISQGASLLSCDILYIGVKHIKLFNYQLLYYVRIKII